MPLFDIQTKITGTAYGQVIAESEEMARDMFNSGDVEMEIDDWDVEVQQHRGGYLSIEESRQKVADDPYSTDSQKEPTE